MAFEFDAASAKPVGEFDPSTAQPVKPRGALSEIGNQLYAGTVSDLPMMAGQAAQYLSSPGRAIYEAGKRISDAAKARGEAADLQPDTDNHNVVTNALAAGARMLPQSVVPAAVVGGAVAALPFELPAAAAVGAGAVLGSLPAAFSQGQQTLDKAKDAGVSDEVARDAARKTALIEGAGEAVGTLAGAKLLGVGGHALSTVANRALGRAEGTAAGRALGDATSAEVLKPWAKTLPEAALTEVGTEMGQNAGEAYVEQQAGIDKTTPWESAQQAVAPTLGMTALMAPFGLVGHGLRAKANARRAETLSAGDAPAEQRAAIAAGIQQQIAEADPQAAANFGEYAQRAIEASEPLVIGEHLFAPPVDVQAQPDAGTPSPGAGAIPATPDPITDVEPRMAQQAQPVQPVAPVDAATDVVPRMSQVMGIDASAGPLSKAAAQAVDSGIHHDTLRRAADAAEAANVTNESPTGAAEPAAPAAQAPVTAPATAAPAGVPEPGAVAAQAPAVAPAVTPGATAFSPETGTLGIPRAQMPQVASVHNGPLVNFLNARGITHELAEVNAQDLKPTQAEYVTDKVKAILDGEQGDKSVLVSSDGHVLDGHHAWLAKLATNQPVKVIRLNAPIAQLIEQVKEFPSAKTAQEQVAAAPAAAEVSAGDRPQVAVQPGAGIADGANSAAKQPDAALSEGAPGAQPAPAAAVQGRFKSADEAQAYISQQRRAGGTQISALPLPHDDGTFGVAIKDSPEYPKAEAYKRDADLKAAGVLPTDILSKAGEPFKTKLAASAALKKAGAEHEAAAVKGGFVVRKREAAQNDAAARKEIQVEHGMSVSFNGKTFPVSSIEDARSKWNEFRTQASREGGGSRDVGNGVIVKQGDKVLGRISYNGRFKAEPKAELTAPTKEEILAQQDRAREASAAEAKAASDAEAKAKADAQRSEFTLTGSDRAADANPDQRPMFSRGERTIEVDGKRHPIENSKGQPIHPTVEGQRNFWKWFGDSKAVDVQGRPLVVYHGTQKAGFSEFKKQGDAWFTSGHPTADLGTWFSETPDVANEFSLPRTGVRVPSEAAPAVYQAHLAISHPKVYDDFSDLTGALRTAKTAKALKASLMREGFDGIEISRSTTDFGGQRRDFIAFKPEQIKSATGNNGDFNASKADIAFSRNDQPFFSALSREVDGINAKSQPASGWQSQIAGLVKAGKVKADEVEWTGLNDWLSMQQGKVTKEQVQQFLRDNGVQVQEVTKGGAGPLPPELETHYRGDEESIPQSAEEWLQEANRFEKKAKTWQAMPGRDADTKAKAQMYFALAERANEMAERLETDSGKEFGSTKYGQYTLPGGTNYREVLLTLPVKGMSREQAFEKAREVSRQAANATDPEEARRLMAEYERLTAEGQENTGYRSSHWDEPNVLAHIRLNDRTDADGKKVLFVEELQSDWAQQRRKNLKVAEESGSQMVRDGAERQTPDAPFIGKTDAWLSLALKRIVKMAADEGYDRVAFVNGEQSAERYDLSKQISEIRYLDASVKRRSEFDSAAPEGRGHLMAYDLSGRIVIDKAVDHKDLPDLIGKEAAQKLLTAPGEHYDAGEGASPAGHVRRRTLRGLDLKVGGEGMKSFYDKIVPSVAKDVVRKLGGDGMREVELAGVSDDPFDRAAIARQPGFDITPAMREKVAGGLPLFRRTDTEGDRAIASMKADALRKSLAPALKNLAIPFELHPLVEDMRKSSGYEDIPEGAKGMHYNDKIYMVAGNIHSVLDAEETLWHEVHHAGMREAYDARAEKWEEALRGISFKNANVRAEAREWFRKYGEEDIAARVKGGDSLEEATKQAKLQAVDEALAQLAGRNATIKGMPQFIAAVQGFMRSVGLEHLANWLEGKTNAEALSMVLRARDAVTTRSESAPMGNAVPAFSRSEAATTPHAQRSQLLSRGLDTLNAAMNHPGKVSWWHKTIGSMYDLAERSPLFKPVFNTAQNFINDVSYYATEAADLAPKLLPKLEHWKDIGKSPISHADNKAIAAPIFQGTLSWTRDENGKAIPEADPNRAGIIWTDAELANQWKLTPAQIALYHEFRQATDRSLDNTAKADMLRFGGKDVRDLRGIVMDSPDIKTAAEVLTTNLEEMAKEEPARADALNALASGIKERAEKFEALKAKGYAPLSRFGRYSVDVVVDGKREYFGLFETRHDSNMMAAKMRQTFGKDNVAQGTMSQRQFEMFQGITPESLELFGNMLGLKSQGNEAQDQAFQEYLKLTKNNRSAMKRLIHRQGIAGYNENVGRVLASFIYSNSRQASAGLHLGEMSEAVNEIPKEQGELKDIAIGLADYIQRPREEAQALRGLLFAQYLGGSVASAFVNMTQPFQVALPYLAQHGLGNAAKALVGAYKDLATGKIEPAVAAAMKRREEDGTLSPQNVHQLMAQARGAASLTGGDGTVAGNAMAKGANALTKLSLGWGKVFGMAEQINRQATYVAAYRLAAEQKMADPDAFAKKAVDETQFVANKANKMVLGRGAVGGTLMTFKSYSLNWLELFHRLATRNGPEGKKAAALMLGTLMLMAGAGGLPFASDLEDLIDFLGQRMGYNFSSKQARQEFLQNVFGKAGGKFVDSGVTGLPGSPIDVSQRFGMGNLIPGTGLLLQKTDHTQDVAELFGPAGDLAARAFKAADQAVSGNFGQAAITVAPKAIGNMAKAADMAATGSYRDDKGYKVIDTNGLEAALKAVGFQPGTVAQVQESNHQHQVAKDFYNLHAADIRARWAKGIAEHDPEQVQQARDMLAEWNEKNPDQRMTANLPAIWKKAREMAKPKDERIAETAPKAMRQQFKRELAESRQ